MHHISNIKKIIKKIVLNNKRSDNENEFSKILQRERYTPATITLFSHQFNIVDSASFFSQYRAIFKSEIYKFNADNPKPYILDCGANIGLSIIYFKKFYPESEIIGFEPDKKIFAALSKNIHSFNLSHVTLVNKGLWNKKTTLRFFSEGADAGRIAVKRDTSNIIKIPTIQLRKYLKKPVDFLKLDIEGAETTVLEDCKDLLTNVKNIFVEYHSFTQELQTLDRLLAILHNNSFRYYISSAGVYTAFPFLEKNYYLGMDNQLNIFATKI